MKPRRGVRIAVAWLGYAALFVAVHDAVNDIAAIAIAVPAVITGRELGLRGGLAAAVALWPVQIGLFFAVDHEPGWDMVAGPGGLFGFVVTSVVAVLAGRIGERARTFESLSRDKDLLVATVSHEARNPLTGVIGMAEILASSWDDLGAGEARELARLIASEGREVAAIIDDLLAAARLGAGTMAVESRVVPLDDLVDGVVAQLGGGVRWVRSEPGVAALGDPARIRQIVRNLLANAVRHGGVDREIVVGGGPASSWVEVVDDGDGVPPGLEQRLFHPFASGGHRESTGLGLAVSRDLARAMGGDLVYRRRAGRTVFRLDLPPAAQSVNRVPA